MDFTSPFNDEVIGSVPKASANPFDSFAATPARLPDPNNPFDDPDNFSPKTAAEMREAAAYAGMTVPSGMVCYPATAAVTAGNPFQSDHDRWPISGPPTTMTKDSALLTASKRGSQREADQRFTAAYTKYQSKAASKGEKVKLSDAEKRLRDAQKELFIDQNLKTLRALELADPELAKARSREGSLYKSFSDWSRPIPIRPTVRSEVATSTKKKAYKGPSATALALADKVSMMPSLRTDPESYRSLDTSAREISFNRRMSRK